MVVTTHHIENVLRIYRRALQRDKLLKVGVTGGRPRAVERVTIPAIAKPRLLLDRIKFQALEQIEGNTS